MWYNLKFFTKPAYTFFCLNNYCLMAGHTIILVHNINFLSTLDFIPNPARLVSILGLANLFGRILFGILCSFKHIQALPTYTFCNLMIGLTTFMLPFAQSYNGMLLNLI